MMALPFKPRTEAVGSNRTNSWRVGHEVECSVRRRRILAGAACSAFAAAPAADPPAPPNDGAASTAPATAAAADTAGAAGGGANQLATIIVTAQRRTENIQDVPISMQALTSQTMRQLNIQTFDDYVKYLPNVTAASNGPGQNEIFMRGVSAGSQASQGSGSTGLWPNVAVYLDDQSVQLPNRNLDIYAADLERIEVLEGPQGTLFGAGAQAGVIRYITNKPQLDTTSGSIDAGYGTTAHGDNNSDVTAVLNLPVIAGHMAVRGVIYDSRRGGYIDNVPATFARANTDVGIHYAGYPAVNGQCPDGQPNNGYCVPPGSPTVNNSQIAHRAINPVEYQGVRIEALYKFNDDWDFADHAVLPGPRLPGRVLPAAVWLRRHAPVAARGDAVQQCLRQGQVREHRLDRPRQGEPAEFRLHRRLSRPQRRAGRRLHQLRPRRLCRLLSVLRALLRRQPADLDLLLAERDLALRGAQRAHAARAALEHPGQLAPARHCGPLLREQCALRPDRLALQEHPRVHFERRAGVPGQHRLPVERRDFSRHQRAESRSAGRQHLVLPGSAPPDPAAGRVFLHQLRSAAAGIDPDGRPASFPLPQFRGGQRPLELRLLRGGQRRPAAASRARAPTSTQKASPIPRTETGSARTSPGTCGRT